MNRKWYPNNDRRAMRRLGELSLNENLTNVDFNVVIGKYTRLNPVETGAIMNATRLEDLNVCRANNYNVLEHQSPLLGCGEYDALQCDFNDYIIMDTNKTDNNKTEKCNVNEVSR